jgi:hypothetical protein
MEPHRIVRIEKDPANANRTDLGEDVYVDNYGNTYKRHYFSTTTCGTNEQIVTIDRQGYIWPKLSTV